MIFSVTQNDIDQGQMGECKLCPVALAVSRRFKDSYASVTPAYLRLYNSRRRMR